MALKPAVFSFPYILLSMLISCLSLSSGVQSMPLHFSDEALFNQAVASEPFSHAIDFEESEIFGARVGGSVSRHQLPGVELSSPLSAIKVLSKNYSGGHNITPGGRNYLAIDTDLRSTGTVVDFDFESTLQSIGFYVIDHDASDTTIRAGGVDYVMPEVSDGEAAFFGLLFTKTSTLVTKIQVDSGKDSIIAIDDLRFTYASNQDSAQENISVDEPSSISLLLMSGLFSYFISLGRRNFQT